MKDLQPKVIASHELPILGMMFSPDGRLFANTSNDRTVCVWGTATWTPERTISARTQYTGALGFSARFPYLAVSEVDDVIVYDLISGESLARLHIPDASEETPLIALEVNDDRQEVGGRICDESSERSRFLRWSIPNGTLVGESNFDEIDTGMWFDDTGLLCIETYSISNSSRRYHVRRQNGPPMADIDLRGLPAGGVPVSSADHSLIALGNRCFGSAIQVLESPSGRVLVSRSGDPDSTPLVAVSPSSRMLAVALSKLRGDRSTLSMITIPDGSLLWQTESPGRIDRFMFNPDGRLLVTVNLEQQSTDFYNVADGELRGRACRGSRGMRFSPDGCWFVSGGTSLMITDIRDL